MARKQLITLEDQETCEILKFHTLQEACDYINQVTGYHTRPAQLHNAMKRCGTVAKKRFRCLCDCDTEPDMLYKEDGWEYAQYEVSSTVIVAEKKLKWYNEDRIERITDYLKQEKCRVYWDLIGDYTGAVRNNTRVEVYKKFEPGITFKKKVSVLQAIINKVKFI